MAFIASSIFTAALTVGGGYGAHVLETRQEQRKGDLTVFREAAAKLDPLVGAFIRVYVRTASVDVDGRPTGPISVDSPEVRKRVLAIRANIQEQNEALEGIKLRLSGREAEVVQGYQDDIVKVASLLQTLPPVEDGKPILDAVASARDARVDVLRVLQERADRLL
ncbi:hypothetical protein ACMGDM_10265 [Sphingomonas sp. DT-51]|uniref:hypothetical protein n=1 Tax=Sphingomonas sp. DT-51 TaxID=3396165 RepID=UPI003F1D5F48